MKIQNPLESFQTCLDTVQTPLEPAQHLLDFFQTLLETIQNRLETVQWVLDSIQPPLESSGRPQEWLLKPSGVFLRPAGNARNPPDDLMRLCGGSRIVFGRAADRADALAQVDRFLGLLAAAAKRGDDHVATVAAVLVMGGVQPFNGGGLCAQAGLQAFLLVVFQRQRIAVGAELGNQVGGVNFGGDHLRLILGEHRLDLGTEPEHFIYRIRCFCFCHNLMRRVWQFIADVRSIATTAVSPAKRHNHSVCC